MGDFLWNDGSIDDEDDGIFNEKYYSEKGIREKELKKERKRKMRSSRKALEIKTFFSLLSLSLAFL